MKVAVIGAGGHVGFPFACVVADAGHTVYGIDVNENTVDLLNKGIAPYREEGAEDILFHNLQNNLQFLLRFLSLILYELDILHLVIFF